MPDLVYTDGGRRDKGVLQAYSLDAAWGSDENDFELTVPASVALEPGALVYIDGSQIGGVVDKVSSEGGDGTPAKYHGRTWHGIMAYSIIQPDAGKDYLTINGDANAVIRTIISRQGLGDIFDCEGYSGITCSGRFDRYVDMYSGLMRMLVRDSDKRGKLHVEKQPGGKVMVQAVDAAAYTSDVDSDRYEFDSVRDYRPVNHLICLGEGDLKARDVVHFYADANGNVSQTQTLFGIDEKCAKYEASSSDHDELLKSGREKLEELQETSSIDMALMEGAGTFDVGDVVGALDNVTGLYVESAVSKVIAKVGEDGLVSYKYEVGSMQAAKVSAGGGGVSMSTLEAGFVKKSGDTMSGRLYIERTTGDSGMTAKRTDKGRSLFFGVGSGGSNRGIYDDEQGKWLFHVNANNEVSVDNRRIPYSELEGGYWGWVHPDGTNEGFVRAPKNGIIPFQRGGSGALGTSGWPWTSVQAKTYYRNGNRLGGTYTTLFSSQSIAKGKSYTYDIAASEFVLFLVMTNNGAYNIGIRSGTRLDFVGGTGNGTNSYHSQGSITFSNSYKTATVTDCSYYAIGGSITNNSANVTGLYGIL